MHRELALVQAQANVRTAELGNAYGFHSVSFPKLLCVAYAIQSFPRMTDDVRRHPQLYEINAWPWLDTLSRREGRALTLGTIPEREWDRLAERGIDLVYLMGLWRRSPLGRQIARSEPQLFDSYDEALPGWRARDVVGSAYCIGGHEPDPRIGTWNDLAAVREKLSARGMRLIVDFIPNHTGFDHPWVDEFPDRYVQGDDAAFRRHPSAFRAIERSTGEVRFLACGRDPFFPPWTDVAQLDYFNDETRAAMIDLLKMLATHADGARCDMAMLALTEVFGSTWAPLVSGWRRRPSSGPTRRRTRLRHDRGGLLGSRMAAPAARVRFHL
jgi:hypothetical protein